MGSTKGTSCPCSGRNPATRDALWRPAARLTAASPPKPPPVDHGVDVREIELSLRARPHATPKVTAPTRMDTNRLAKELREIQSDTKSGVTVEVLGDNLAHMQGTLKGASPSVHLPPFRPSRGTAVRIRATQIRPFARPPSGPHPGPTRSRPPSISPPIHRTIHPPQDPRNPRTRAASST